MAFELFPAQRKFIRNALKPGVDIAAAYGSVRSTKSAAAAAVLIYHCEKFKSGRGLISGRSAQTVESNVISPYIEPMAKERGVHYEFNRSRWEINLAGVKLDVKGALNERSQDLIQGRTYHIALCDEIALQPKSFVDQTMARMSVEGAKLIATMNPTATRHWIKKEWLDVLPMYKQYFRLEDNLSLSVNTIAKYYRSFTGAQFQRMVKGVFADAGGVIYQQYKVAEGPLPEFDMVVCGIDAAISSITAALWMGRIKGTHNWLIFDE